jgi:heme oxygenase
MSRTGDITSANPGRTKKEKNMNIKYLREGHGLGGMVISKDCADLDAAKKAAREWMRTFDRQEYRYGEGNTHDVLLTWNGRRWIEDRP